jgi:predicted nuclease of predicted toxin-antitoxin system
VKFLIDECLHTSLVAMAEERGHEARHVNWLGLSGETDWDLMPKIIAQDFTFVTNNARDFRKLNARQELHAGLVIIVPQVVPVRQREPFDVVLDELAIEDVLINEVIEIELDEGTAVITRYSLPESGAESI